MKPRGAMVLFGAQPFTTDLINSNRKWFKYCWVWEKTKPSGFVHAKNMPLKSHEDICVFSRGTIAHISQSKNRMIYNPQGIVEINKSQYRPSRKNGSDVSMGDRPSLQYNWVQTHTGYPRTVLKFSNPNNYKLHNSPKPLDLLEYLIRTYTNPGDLVLDNVMGSGTTGHACVNLSRRFIGIELDAKYYEIAKARITKAQTEPWQMEFEL